MALLWLVNGAEDEATNVREVGNASGLDLSYLSRMDELSDEPEANQKREPMNA